MHEPRKIANVQALASKTNSADEALVELFGLVIKCVDDFAHALDGF